jgi:Domain of unknown function (DUF5615)
MLSLLSDENFNGDIVRGLFLRQPNLDLIRVQDAGLRELDDPATLAWAAINKHILLTHAQQVLAFSAVGRHQCCRVKLELKIGRMPHANHHPRNLYASYVYPVTH